MRALALMYWIPVLLICFYASAFPKTKAITTILIFISTCIAFLVSYRLSGLTLKCWYHEIALCGTDKIAMSVTALSLNNTHIRLRWMSFFEFYFGFCIKFINPACLTFFLFESAAADLKHPYGIIQGFMPRFALIYFIIALFIIFIPMMMCDYPEIFDHDMLLEFQADEINETKDKIKVLMDDHLREGLKKAVARSNSIDSKTSSPNGKRNSINQNSLTPNYKRNSFV